MHFALIRRIVFACAVFSPSDSPRHTGASVAASAAARFAVAALLFAPGRAALAQDVTPPSTPTNFVASALSSTEVELSWNASTDNVGVAGYYVSVNDDWNNLIGPMTSTSVRATGLSTGTYMFRVSAFDAVLNASPWTDLVPATTPSADTPSVPAGLVATAVSATEVDLTWYPSTDDQAVAGYQVYRDDTLLRPVTETSFKDGDGDLSSGTHRYWVRSLDAAGNVSEWTHYVEATTLPPDTQKPSVPGNLVATAASPTQVNLSWNAATDNVAVTGYVVYLDDALLAETTATSFQHAGRTPGASYNYRVSAFDAPGPPRSDGGWRNDGDWTATVTATTPSSDTQTPSIPTGLTATAVSSTQIDLSWNPATDNVAVAGYIVYDDPSQTPLAITTSTSFQHTGLSPNAPHGYRVSAFDWVPNHGSWTPPVSATTLGTDAFPITATFSSTLDEFPNPERGFMEWTNHPNLSLVSWKALIKHRNYGAAYGAYYPIDTSDEKQPRGPRDYSYRVDLFRELLPNTDTLDQSFIYKLNRAANMHRISGTKMIMQFVYDNDEMDAVAVIPPLTRILGHIAQLEQFFKANADVIVAVHAGFLGVYGEWANWQGQLPPMPASDKEAVRDALYSAVGRDTPIGFRDTPDLKLWYDTPLTAQQAFYTFNNRARSGVHNDCWLYDDNDAATYSSNGRTTADNPWRLYHSQMSEWTTTGGENCGDTTYDENPQTSPLCSYALDDGPLYHWRYLHDSRDFKGVFSTAWTSQGCLATINRSLGYRFQLDAMSSPTSAARGSNLRVAIDLRNVGWSRIFSARKLVVTLRNHDSGALLTGAAGDMRFLPSQATSSTRVVVTVPIPSGAATGVYDVYLSMPDVAPGLSGNPDFSVRFANKDNYAWGQLWETATGRLRTGNISIQ